MIEKIRKELGITPGSEADEMLREIADETDKDFLPEEEQAAIIKRRYLAAAASDE